MIDRPTSINRTVNPEARRSGIDACPAYFLDSRMCTGKRINGGEVSEL